MNIIVGSSRHHLDAVLRSPHNTVLAGNHPNPLGHWVSRLANASGGKTDSLSIPSVVNPHAEAFASAASVSLRELGQIRHFGINE